MTRHFRFLVCLMFLAAAGLAWPSGAAAQRHVSGGVHAGGAVARGYPSHVYGPYYGARYYHGYGYPRYYYPYYYSRYYYPYYSSFAFSVGFGWPGYWGAYGYPYYGYPYYGYPYYGYPYAYQSSAAVPSEPASAPARVGTLSIRVSPADAVILVDGEAWDRPQQADRLSVDLAEGPYHVEIRKDGRLPYAQTVDILAGRTFTLNVSLAPGGTGELRASR